MGSEDIDTLEEGCLFVIKVVVVGDVQLLNRVQLFVTCMPGLPVPHHLPDFA